MNCIDHIFKHGLCWFCRSDSSFYFFVFFFIFFFQIITTGFLAIGIDGWGSRYVCTTTTITDYTNLLSYKKILSGFIRDLGIFE